MATSEGERTGSLWQPSRTKVACGACLKPYNRPKLLPCFHTFCQTCLETLAGSNPSVSCPACGTIVVLPPGGVADLQANFYLEKDLARHTPQEDSACDVCCKERTASHKCVQCQQMLCKTCLRLHDALGGCATHNVIAVTRDSQQKENKGALEKKCAKHRNQLLLLFCRVCEVCICVQCKLTAHDGHETEDVVDTGARAREVLKEELEDLMGRKKLLDAILLRAQQFQDDIQTEGHEVESAVKSRAEQLIDLVSQAREEALHTVLNTTKMAVDALTSCTKPVQERHAALEAKCQHIHRVITEAEDSEVVALLARLKEEMEQGGGRKAMQAQDDVTIERTTVQHEFKARAVRYNDVLAFVGVARDGQVLATRTLGTTSLSSRTLSPRLHENERPKLDFIKHKMSKGGCEAITEVIYSRNKRSSMDRMCLTPEDGIWVVYNPGANVYLMSLFDDDGLCVYTRYEEILQHPLVTCEDTVLSLADGKWVRPGGEGGNLEKSPGLGGSYVSKSLIPYVLQPDVNGIRQIHRIASLKSLPPEIDPIPLCSTGLGNSLRFDVSVDRKFFVFNSSPVSVYDKVVSSPKLRAYASYTPEGGGTPTDVCFCVIDGLELLLVALADKNTVHVVDHKDGCCFVRELVTPDKCQLDRPTLLATNHQGRVWVGCQTGKVIIVEM